MLQINFYAGSCDIASNKMHNWKWGICMWGLCRGTNLNCDAVPPKKRKKQINVCNKNHFFSKKIIIPNAFLPAPPSSLTGQTRHQQGVWGTTLPTPEKFLGTIFFRSMFFQKNVIFLRKCQSDCFFFKQIMQWIFIDSVHKLCAGAVGNCYSAGSSATFAFFFGFCWSSDQIIGSVFGSPLTSLP